MVVYITQVIAKRGPLAIILACTLVAALAALAFFLVVLPALGGAWGANAAPDLAVLGSLRLLGTGEQGTYWVARNQGGDVCYWYELGGSSTMGGVCTTPERFNAEGVGARTSDAPNGVTIESYLLPDRAVPGHSAQYVVELPGVIIIDPGTPSFSQIKIPASTGNPLAIHTLGPL